MGLYGEQTPPPVKESTRGKKTSVNDNTSQKNNRARNTSKESKGLSCTHGGSSLTVPLSAMTTTTTMDGGKVESTAPSSSRCVHPPHVRCGFSADGGGGRENDVPGRLMMYASTPSQGSEDELERGARGRTMEEERR